MAYVAQCAPERIPMALVEGAVDDKAVCLQAVAALGEVSLLKADPFEDGTPAMRVHRLVQAVARGRSAAKGTTQRAIMLLTAWLMALYPTDAQHEPQSWPLCAQLTPHVLAQRAANPSGIMNIPNWPFSWADLLYWVGGYFYGRASFGQATPFLRDALTLREKALGAEHVDTAKSLRYSRRIAPSAGRLQGCPTTL
jgi:hypothetical protein